MGYRPEAFARGSRVREEELFGGGVAMLERGYLTPQLHRPGIPVQNPRVAVELPLNERGRTMVQLGQNFDDLLDRIVLTWEPGPTNLTGALGPAPVTRKAVPPDGAPQ